MSLFYNSCYKIDIPIFFDVNVTARRTISTGVVRHKMYLTSSLKISTKHLKNNYAMGCTTFQEERKNSWLAGCQ